MAAEHGSIACDPDPYLVWWRVTPYLYVRMLRVQLEDPSRAFVQLDGLPIHEVATMDEASRKKLLEQLDGKMKYAAQSSLKLWVGPVHRKLFFALLISVIGYSVALRLLCISALAVRFAHSHERCGSHTAAVVDQ